MRYLATVFVFPFGLCVISGLPTYAQSNVGKQALTFRDRISQYSKIHPTWLCCRQTVEVNIKASSP